MAIGISTPFGYAVGGLAKFAGGAMEMVGGMANLASKSIGTIGEVVKASNKGKEADQTVNEENLGMIAAVGKQKVVSGKGTIPIIATTPVKPNVKATMATEKLLGIAVTYLKSIDETLKKSIQINNQQVREEEDARKESEIEDSGENKISRWLKEKRDSAARRAMNTGGSLLKTAAIAALLLGVTKIASLDTSEIKKLKKTLNEFEQKWGPAFAILSGFLTVGWLTRTLFGKSLVRSLWELFKLIPKNPFLIAAGAVTAGMLYAINQGIYGDINKKLERLWTDFGIFPTNRDTFIIDGKEYKKGEVPQKYQDIIDRVVLGERPQDNWYQENLKRNKENDDYYTLRQGNPNAMEGYGLYGAPDKPIEKYDVKQILALQTEVLDKNKTRTSGEPAMVGLGMYNLTSKQIQTYSNAALDGKSPSDYVFGPGTQDAFAFEIYKANREGDLGKTTNWKFFQGSTPGQYKNVPFNDIRLQIMEAEGTLRRQAPSDPTPQAPGGILATGIDAIVTARDLVAEMTGQNTDAINYASRVNQANADGGLAERIREEAKLNAADVIAGLTGTKDKQGQALATTPRQRLASAFNAGKMDTLDPTFPYDQYPLVSAAVMQGVLL